MLNVESSIILHGDPASVWKVLTDFDQYGEWNPFMTAVKGNAGKGNRLKVDMVQLSDQTPYRAKPRITVFEEGKELRWLSRLYFPKLYDAEHYFVLEEVGNRKIKLTHGETYSGWIANALYQKLSDDTLKGIKAMDQALKKRLKTL